MKTLNFLLMALIITSACSSSQNSTKELELEIINTDIEMSNAAVDEGFLNSLYKYADENFVMFNEGSHPVIGKKAFKEKYKKPGPKTLTWKPVDAKVAESGELGYTWGNWTFTLPDTTHYGNYFTVWKKQKDGKWKMLLDGGNGTPVPE